ncbi:hypothetical protein [Thalassotalea crassostreae]|uniref:hypothetical protein n=1 Tax=Thalassotalea crassostreae TaxID=1763536 RepID=UPI000837AD4C|nr:hypothetical protein [Thalassotalea crassostreae]
MNLVQKTTTAVAALLVSAVLSSSYADALKDGEYTITLMNNCKVVSEYAMNSTQFQAYKELQNAEQEMQDLEQPIEEIQHQIEQYSDEIERLSEKIEQQTEAGNFHNTAEVKELNKLSSKLSTLMKKHQPSFDKLNKQGRKIGDVAMVFEQAIQANVPDIKYDQMRISSAENKQQNINCYAAN